MRNVSYNFLRRLKAESPKNSQKFNRVESRILGALSQLEELLLNLQIRTLSGTIPETSWNTHVENQEPTGDRSQNDPHSKVEFSVCQSRSSIGSDPEEASHTSNCNRLFAWLNKCQRHNKPIHVKF